MSKKPGRRYGASKKSITTLERPASIPLPTLEVCCEPKELTPYAEQALRDLTLEDVFQFDDGCCPGLQFLSVLCEQHHAAVAVVLVEWLGGGKAAKKKILKQIAAETGVFMHGVVDKADETLATRFANLPRERHTVTVRFSDNSCTGTAEFRALD